MKQKEIVLRASRFSLIMAFVLGTLFGLNSCRDEFNDEDALRAELEALAAARAQAEQAANERLADSLRNVLILDAQQTQAAADSAQSARDWLAYRDSLAAIKGVFNLNVNVIYGNTATNAGDRTSANELSGVKVFLSQTVFDADGNPLIDSETVVTEGDAHGIARFEGIVAGEVTGHITAPGFTPVDFEVVLDGPSRDSLGIIDGAPGEGGLGFTPPTYEAAITLPIFRFQHDVNATDAALVSDFTIVKGRATADLDLTENGLDFVPAGTVVSATINAEDDFFDVYTKTVEISNPAALAATGTLTRLNFSDAVFVGSVDENGEYRLVVPGSPNADGLPLRISFGDFSTTQNIFDVDGSVMTMNATFGPSVGESPIPNSSFYKIEVNGLTESALAAGTGAGAAAFAAVDGESGALTDVVFGGEKGVYSHAPVLYIAGSGDLDNPIHPALVADGSYAKGTIDVNSEVTIAENEGGSGYDALDAPDVAVVPAEYAYETQIGILNGSSFKFDSASNFTFDYKVSGGMLYGTPDASSATGYMMDANGNQVIDINVTGASTYFMPIVRFEMEDDATAAEQPEVAATGEAYVTTDGKLMVRITNRGSGYDDNKPPVMKFYKRVGNPELYAASDLVDGNLIPYNWTAKENSAAPYGYTFAKDGTAGMYGDASIALTIDVDGDLPWDESTTTWTVMAPAAGNVRNIGVADETAGTATDMVPAAQLSGAPTIVDQAFYFNDDNPEGDDFTQAPRVNFFATDAAGARIANADLAGNPFVYNVVAPPVEQGAHGDFLEVNNVVLDGTPSNWEGYKYANLEMELVSSVTTPARIAAVYTSNVSQAAAVNYTTGNALSANNVDETALTSFASGDPEMTVTTTLDNRGRDYFAAAAAEVTQTFAADITNVQLRGTTLTNGSPAVPSDIEFVDGTGTPVTGNTANIAWFSTADRGFGYDGSETVTFSYGANGVSGASTDTNTSNEFSLVMGDGYLFSFEVAGVSVADYTGLTNGDEVIFRALDIEGSSQAETNLLNAINPDPATLATYMTPNAAAIGTVLTTNQATLDAAGEGVQLVAYANMEDVDNNATTPMVNVIRYGLYKGAYGKFTFSQDAPVAQINSTAGVVDDIYVVNGGSYRTSAGAATGAYQFSQELPSTVLNLTMSFDQVDDIVINTDAAVAGTKLFNNAILVDANFATDVEADPLNPKTIPAAIQVTTDASGAITGVVDADGNAANGIQPAFKGVGYRIENEQSISFRLATRAEIEMIQRYTENNGQFVGSAADAFGNADDTNFTLADIQTANALPLAGEQNFDALGLADSFDATTAPTNQVTAGTAGYNFFDRLNGAVFGATTITVHPSWGDGGVTGYVFNGDAATVAPLLAAPFDPIANDYTANFAIENSTYTDIDDQAVAGTFNTRIAGVAGTSATALNELGDDVDASWANVIGRANGSTDAEETAALTAAYSGNPLDAAYSNFLIVDDVPAWITAALAATGSTLQAQLDIAATAANGGAPTVFAVTDIDASWNAVNAVPGPEFSITPTNAQATEIYNVLTTAFDLSTDDYTDVFGVYGVIDATAEAIGSTSTQAPQPLPNVTNTGAGWDQVRGYFKVNVLSLTPAQVTELEGYLNAAYDVAQNTAAVYGQYLEILSDNGADVEFADRVASNEISVPFATAGIDASWDGINGVLTFDPATNGTLAGQLATALSAAFTAPADYTALGIFANQALRDGLSATAPNGLALTTQDLTGRISQVNFTQLDPDVAGNNDNLAVANTLAGGERTITIPVPNGADISFQGAQTPATFIAVADFGINPPSGTLEGDTDFGDFELVNSGAGYPVNKSNIVITSGISSAGSPAIDYVAMGDNSVVNVQTARELLGVEYTGTLADDRFRGDGVLSIAAPALLAFETAENGGTAPASPRSITASNVAGLWDNSGSHIFSYDVTVADATLSNYTYNWVSDAAMGTDPYAEQHGNPTIQSLALNTGVTLPAGFDVSLVTTGNLGLTLTHAGPFQSINVKEAGAGYTAKPIFKFVDGIKDTDPAKEFDLNNFNERDAESMIGDDVSAGLTFNTTAPTGTRPNSLFLRDFRLMAYLADGSFMETAVDDQIRNVIVRNPGSIYFSANDPMYVGTTPTTTTINGVTAIESSLNVAIARGSSTETGTTAEIKAYYEVVGGNETGRLVFDIINSGSGYRTVPTAMIQMFTGAITTPVTLDVSDNSFGIEGITVSPEFKTNAMAVFGTTAPYVYVRHTTGTKRSDDKYKYAQGLAYAAADHDANDIALFTYNVSTGELEIGTYPAGHPMAGQPATGNNYTRDNIQVYVTSVANNGHQFASFASELGDNANTDAETLQQYLVRQTSVAEGDYYVTTGEGMVDAASVDVFHGGSNYSVNEAPYVVFAPSTLLTGVGLAANASAGDIDAAFSDLANHVLVANWILNNWESKGHSIATGRAEVNAEGAVTGITDIDAGSGYTNGDVRAVFLNNKEAAILTRLLTDEELRNEQNGLMGAALQAAEDGLSVAIANLGVANENLAIATTSGDATAITTAQTQVEAAEQKRDEALQALNTAQAGSDAQARIAKLEELWMNRIPQLAEMNPVQVNSQGVITGVTFKENTGYFYNLIETGTDVTFTFTSSFPGASGAQGTLTIDENGTVKGATITAGGVSYPTATPIAAPFKYSGVSLSGSDGVAGENALTGRVIIRDVNYGTGFRSEQ